MPRKKLPPNDPPLPRGRAGGRKPQDGVPYEQITILVRPDQKAFLEGFPGKSLSEQARAVIDVAMVNKA